MPIIYISSTFRDLEPYRENMLTTLRFLTDNGAYFTLKRSMESMMPGSDQPALSQCIDDVNSCNIYILVIGKLYGSIAPGTNLSFTEHEFLAAQVAKKNILPFVADPNAEGLAGIAVDNAEAFARFKNTVQDEYVKFAKDFTNPFHLSTQMLLALYKFSEKKWPLQDVVKYCCNRDMPYLQFKREKRQNQLNLAAIVCSTDDKPDFFTQRIAKYVFGLQREYIEMPLRTSTFIGNITSYTKHRSILMSHLINTFLGNSEDMPDTLEDCCQLLVNKKIDNIFIRLYLTPRDIANKIVCNTLETFFGELAQICVGKSLTIYYAVIFELPRTEPVTDSLGQWITANPRIRQGRAYDLNGFAGITRDNVDDWANQYVIDRATAGNIRLWKLDDFLDDRFTSPDSSMTMKETFYLLTDLIDLIK